MVSVRAVIMELDWSKFDREQPHQDLEFMVEVVGSCFHPTDAREMRLLKAYLLMMRRVIVERPVVMDLRGGSLYHRQYDSQW